MENCVVSVDLCVPLSVVELVSVVDCVVLVVALPVELVVQVDSGVVASALELVLEVDYLQLFLAILYKL